MLSFLPDHQQPESSSSAKSPDIISQQGWGARGAAPGTDGQDHLEDPSPVLLDGLHSLAEAEKLFDELTQEKQQVGLAECGRMLCRSSSHHTLLSRHVSTRILIVISQRRKSPPKGSYLSWFS